MAKQEVWRKVDGQAIRCTDCEMNVSEPLYGEDGDEKPVGTTYKCVAMDRECIFLHKVPDNEEWYPNYRDIYKEED